MRFYRFIRALIKPFVFLLYRVKKVGAKNEPDTPYIVFANHSSFIDPILLAVTLKQSVRFAAKVDLTKHALPRWFFKHLGCVTLNRDGKDMQSIRELVGIINDGTSVGIFPQGTRIPYKIPSSDDALPGFAAIAKMSKATLLPVSIITKRLRPGIFRRTTVIIGEPITYDEYMSCAENPTREQITAYCFDRVAQRFENADAKN